MTTKELQSKLNKLNEKMKFSVEEHSKDGTAISADSSIESGLKLIQVYKGEIDIHAELGDEKILMAKILPPHDPLIAWSVDLESQVSCYDSESLIVYMKFLAIVDQFLTDKEKNNEEQN